MLREGVKSVKLGQILLVTFQYCSVAASGERQISTTQAVDRSPGATAFTVPTDDHITTKYWSVFRNNQFRKQITIFAY